MPGKGVQQVALLAAWAMAGQAARANATITSFFIP
jgi:hypothetical protein